MPHGTRGDIRKTRTMTTRGGSAKSSMKTKVKGLCAPWMVWRMPWMADCGQAGYSLIKDVIPGLLRSPSLDESEQEDKKPSGSEFLAGVGACWQWLHSLCRQPTRLP